jgi:hypothetical protein
VKSTRELRRALRANEGGGALKRKLLIGDALVRLIVSSASDLVAMSKTPL